MRSWPTKKLADLLETCDTGVWGSPAAKGNGLFVLRSTNMTNDGHLNFSDVAERNIEGDIKKLKLSDGDILVEKSGGGPDQPVGRVAYFIAPNDQAYSFANFIQRLRAKSDLIDSRFLFYRLLFLHKIGFTKKLQSQTTGIRNLKLSLYLKTEIPTPPLKIQKQIVGRMEKIVEAQKLNDGLIQKSDELFQSLLHKELNPAGPADAKAMAGKKNWEVKELGEVAQVKGGKRIPKGMNFSSERTSHPYLRVVDFMDGSIRIENLKYISDGIFKFIKNYTISPKDIYISIAGTIGLVGKIPEVLDGASLTENAAKILVDENKIDQDYLAFILTTIQSKKQIKKFTQAVGVPKLALERIEKIQIFFPPLEIQKQIVAKLSAVQEYKKQLHEQKSKLKELFDSVLHKSMRGDVN